MANIPGLLQQATDFKKNINILNTMPRFLIELSEYSLYTDSIQTRIVIPVNLLSIM